MCLDTLYTYVTFLPRNLKTKAIQNHVHIIIILSCLLSSIIILENVILQCQFHFREVITYPSVCSKHKSHKHYTGDSYHLLDTDNTVLTVHVYMQCTLYINSFAVHIRICTVHVHRFIHCTNIIVNLLNYCT